MLKGSRILKYQSDSKWSKTICAAINTSIIKYRLDILGDIFVNRTNYYILGGFIRNILAKRYGMYVHNNTDLDVFGRLNNSSIKRLKKLPGKLRRTTFGGYRWFPPDGENWVDVWDIKKTVCIQMYKLYPSPINVLWGAPFNIDRIMFNIKSGVLYDGGCMSCMRNKILTYIPRWPYYSAIQIVRALYYCVNCNINPDKTVMSLLDKRLTKHDLKSMKAYSSNNNYSWGEIRNMYKILNGYALR